MLIQISILKAIDRLPFHANTNIVRTLTAWIIVGQVNEVAAEAGSC